MPDRKSRQRGEKKQKGIYSKDPDSVNKKNIYHDSKPIDPIAGIPISSDYHNQKPMGVGDDEKGKKGDYNSDGGKKDKGRYSQDVLDWARFLKLPVPESSGQKGEGYYTILKECINFTAPTNPGNIGRGCVGNVFVRENPSDGIREF